MDNHGNENNGFWYSADNPGNYVGLSSINKLVALISWVIDFFLFLGSLTSLFLEFRGTDF